MTAAFVITVTLVMVIVGGALLTYAGHSAVRSADAVSGAFAARIGHDVELFGPAASLADERDDMKAHGAYFVILDANSRNVRSSSGGRPPWPATSGDWRVRSVRSGRYTIVAGMPLQSVESALHAEAVMLALLGASVAVAVGVGAWIVVGRTLSPIGALARQAQVASTACPDVRLSSPSGDAEVVDLVSTLNGLLAGIRETVAARETFYAAASHELRTPLQALTGHLEMALRRRRTPPEYRAAISEANTQTRRLIALSQDLLVLSRLQARGARPAAERVDLGAECDVALDQLGGVIRERRLQVCADLHDDAVALGAPPQVRMLVRNLMENAVKYATAGGVVHVTMPVSATGSRLRITNDCSGLTDAVVQRLTEPFFRPDSARAPASGGTGLGLSICQVIADTNGWPLALGVNEGRFTATVDFYGSNDPVGQA